MRINMQKKDSKIKISIIVAIGENRELGKDNKLLWHIPGELPRFKKITLGHPVIMGRKTFEAILERRGGTLLPERTNIVVTRNKKYKAKGCFVFHSLEEAIDFAKTKDNKEIFIIGGGQIYHQAINLADKLYLTIVEGSYEADTFFPVYSQFKKVVKEEKKQSEGYKYRFLELDRGMNSNPGVSTPGLNYRI